MTSSSLPGSTNAANSTSVAAQARGTGAAHASPAAGLANASLKQLHRVLAAASANHATGFSNTLTVNCAQGGTATIILTAASAHQVSTGDTALVSADNCVDGDNKANGAISLDFNDVTGTPSSRSAWSATITLTFTNFTFEEGDEADTANGALTLDYDQTAARTATFSLTGDELQLLSADAGTMTDRRLSGFNTSGSLNGDVLTYRTAFTLSGEDLPRLGDGPYTVATSTDFVQQEGSNPSQGVLTVTASDSSSLRLTTLDPTNVNLALDANGDGTADLDMTTTWEALEDRI